MSTLSALKNTYTDAFGVYQAYLESSNGQHTWKDAYERFPHHNDGGNDTDNAMDYILHGLEEWLLEQVSEHEYDQAQAWYTTLEPELQEATFAGLT